MKFMLVTGTETLERYQPAEIPLFGLVRNPTIVRHVVAFNMLIFGVSGLTALLVGGGTPNRAN